jgi:hypothetical protein
MVAVSLTVTGPDGRYVPGLTAGDFRVLEDSRRVGRQAGQARPVDWLGDGFDGLVHLLFILSVSTGISSDGKRACRTKARSAM